MNQNYLYIHIGDHVVRLKAVHSRKRLSKIKIKIKIIYDGNVNDENNTVDLIIQVR